MSNTILSRNGTCDQVFVLTQCQAARAIPTITKNSSQSFMIMPAAPYPCLECAEPSTHLETFLEPCNGLNPICLVFLIHTINPRAKTSVSTLVFLYLSAKTPPGVLAYPIPCCLEHIFQVGFPDWVGEAGDGQAGNRHEALTAHAVSSSRR
jgi:hypothetical protein